MAHARLPPPRPRAEAPGAQAAFAASTSRVLLWPASSAGAGAGREAGGAPAARGPAAGPMRASAPGSLRGAGIAARQPHAHTGPRCPRTRAEPAARGVVWGRTGHLRAALAGDTARAGGARPCQHLHARSLMLDQRRVASPAGLGRRRPPKAPSPSRPPPSGQARRGQRWRGAGSQVRLWERGGSARPGRLTAVWWRVARDEDSLGFGLGTASFASVPPSPAMPSTPAHRLTVSYCVGQKNERVSDTTQILYCSC